jgi:hypothetical protein
MTPHELDSLFLHLRQRLGAHVARPVAYAGVIAVPTGLAPTAQNLAALEAAFAFVPLTALEKADERRI